MVGHDAIGVNREKSRDRFRSEDVQQPSAPTGIGENRIPFETAQRNEITPPANIIESLQSNVFMVEHDCPAK